MNDHADRLRAPTVDARGRRRWLYPDRRPGARSRIRARLALFLVALYIITPFIKVGQRPLLRFDVLEAIIYVGGQSFRFSDAAYLVFVFLGLALALGFVTSIWGRIWCGYACPQTVFVEWVIRPIEEFFEGPAHRRQRQDAGPWSPKLVLSKLGKHIVYFLVIWAIANSFLAYFIDPKQLMTWISAAPSEHPFAFGFMILTFAALYFDLVWFREQFCSFLCPYARFQSVMISQATPTIAYDLARGEPRLKKKIKPTEGAGDCIDCGLCVRVCPTGIDIRQGLQLECIQCGRCADACDTIMGSLKRPKGLIRTASERELQGKPHDRRLLRLRPLVYLLLIIVNTTVLSLTLGTRGELDVTLLRQSGTTYTEVGQDSYANYFTLRVVNRGEDARTFAIAEQAPLKLLCPVCGKILKGDEEVRGHLVVIFPRSFTGDELEIKIEGEEAKAMKVSLLRPAR